MACLLAICPPPPQNLPFCNAPPTCPAVVALPCPANPAQNGRPCASVHPTCTASNCNSKNKRRRKSFKILK